MNSIPGLIDVITILHVDDDESQLAMMSLLLKSFDSNINIKSISNPLDVPYKIENSSYDCLITDYKMPEMNGIELSRKIRKTSNIPIILYTGQGSEEVAEHAFSVGINEYFRKEIHPQQYQVLAKKIRNLVEKQRIEHIYTSVVEEAQDAIGIILNDKLVFSNKSFEKLIGVNSTTKILGRPFHSVIGIKKDHFIKEINRFDLSQDKYFSVEIEIGKRNRIPVEMNLSKINYFGDNGILCFLRDITSRKQFETRIKKSEARYRTLLELAPDGIITMNRRGIVTWINSSYTKITGFTEEEIVGKRVWTIDAVRAPDISMFFKLFYDQIRGKAIPPVEFQWVSKEGKIGWGEGRASLLKVDNVINEVLLITRDITERKELEENLKKYTIEVERLANERAEKLIESEKMVSAGAVASTVAHDLKGPLSVIRNAVYMMENNLGNNSDMIKMIKKSVDNAVNMLDETHEKVTTDILKVEEIEIKEFIESIVSETPIPPRIKVKVKLVESVLCIDKLKIRRVLENLLRNAFEATLSKGTVQIENQIKKGKMVIIVKDSGEGIPTEKIKHLFKPFYTTKKKGTGLGLYYCKNTIEAHNGTIEVTSKQGSGTTITLTIPLSGKEEMEYSTQNIIPEIMSPSFFPQ